MMQCHAMRCGSEFCEGDASALSLAVLKESDVVAAEFVSPDVFLSGEVL